MSNPMNWGNILASRELCRAFAGVPGGSRILPQGPLVLMVQLTLVILFELVLLGKTLETDFRHECWDALGVEKMKV